MPLNWEAISAIGQIVGAIAVVISLIYLAREIRSNAHATRRAAMRSLLEAFNQLAQQLSSHSDLTELWLRGVHDLESLEGVDLRRFSSHMHQLFRNAEDAYHQHLEGHLDPRVWRGLEAVMREINTAPGVQAWWRSHSHWFGGEEFVKFINHQQQIESCLRHRRLYKRKPKELQNCRRFSLDAARPMAGRRIDPSPRTVESPTTPDGATLRYGRSPARGKNRKRWLARFALTK